MLASARLKNLPKTLKTDAVRQWKMWWKELKNCFGN